MATAATSTPVAGLCGSCLTARRSSKLSSAFVQGSVAPVNALRTERCMARLTCFKQDWLRADYNVVGFGLLGWVAPSSIPLLNGKSLTGLFLDSIGPELAHWPTGPALTSPFWFFCLTWHVGLFACLFFGQIGVKGRADGYF